MKFVLCFVFATVPLSGVAQQLMVPGGVVRPARPVASSEMTLEYKGVRIEVIESRRVRMDKLTAGDVGSAVVAADGDFASLSAGNPVLVFNSDYASYGMATGEIVFGFRIAGGERDFPQADFPGFSKVGNLAIFSVQARSPREFVSVFNRLKSRTDLSWVEPTVKYVAAIADDRIRQ